MLFVACLLLAGLASAAAVRDQILFDAGWRFHLGDVTGGQQPELDDSAWRALDLPHDWSAEAGFSPTNASCTGYLPGGIGWYRKTFTAEAPWQGRKVLVTFDGVYRNADVWINGHHLGQRPCGYITFQHDLTAFVSTNRPNVLAVRVERQNVADSRWYPGSGIYRHVWLTVAHPVHVPLWGNYFTTPRADAQSADVVLRTEVTNGTSAAQSVRVAWLIEQPDGSRLAELADSEMLGPGAGHTFAQWQKVAAPRLWSPDSPALYTVISRVFIGDELVDEMRTLLGIRSLYFDANQGFFLNGRNLKLKGVCLHHDGGVVGAAVPEDVLARRLKLVREIGGNAIRCSHNPMAPELYDLCDRLGLLVMDEAFDEWEIGKRKWVEGRNVGQAGRFGYSAAFAQWGERDCADMVRRDRNHPSIILWSLGNEIDYPTDPYVLAETRAVEGFAQKAHQPQQTRLAVVAPELIAAVKRYDPTRPVTMALANMTSSDATGLAQMLDAVGYNYQEDAYARDHQAFPTRVIYGSENGRGFEQWKAVTDNPFIAGQFLWVGFDFLGEAGEWPNHGSQSGLFDTRGFKKPGAWQRQAIWAEAPMVALAVELSSPRRGPRMRPGRFVPHWNWPATTNHVAVVAFSNCERVELRLNGRALETRPVSENRAASFEVAYAPGELMAVGFRGGRAVATNTLVTAGKPTALRLELDRESLPADGRSVAHATVSVVDADGHLVYLAQDAVTAEADGSGRLLGLDNGDQRDPSALSSRTKKVQTGQALALLQAGRAPGKLRLRVTAPGLKPAEVLLPVSP
jgi:beta-galactosidase/beta-glucuronidase